MQENSNETFDIRFEDREGYLYVFVSGDHDSLAVTKEYWQRAIEECYARAYKRLLVEEEFPNQLSTMDMYTGIVAVTEMLTNPLKVAFVDRKAEHTDLNLFAENVAVNRGVFGRIFSRVSDAEEWLKS